MKYKHIQIGYLMIFALFITTVIFGIVLSQTGFNLAVIIFMAAILLIMISFSTLEITIDEKNIGLKFGYGIFRRKFAVNDVLYAKKAKNHWYYGWGIRLWFWPKMWVYNVSGFNAVEITMKNGSIYRIGTDEPDKLEEAILKSIKR